MQLGFTKVFFIDIIIKITGGGWYMYNKPCPIISGSLKLVYPAPEHELQWREIIEEIESAKEKIVPYALKLNLTDYTEYIARTDDYFLSNNIDPKHVAATTFFLVGDYERILGAVNIRHTLNDYLMTIGGNIGYGIRPTERRKGYATQMLGMALDYCKSLGLSKALVTCNKGNIGSARTILNNEGMLENEYMEDDGNIVQRYWIEIR
jgi:predicted acetyltransferase